MLSVSVGVECVEWNLEGLFFSISVGVDCQSGALEVFPATAAAFLSSSDSGSLFL